MGNNEAEKPAKSEKPSSPHQGQNNVHMYPDWAAVQAYYGSGAMPAPYYNPAVTSGHPPHPYMWVPPQMMHPYGSPYGAIYPHGGIYGHSPAPVVATPVSAEPPTRSSGDDSGSKKLKESGGQNNASGNGNIESGGEGGTQGHSQSGDSGTDGSCERSEGSTSREVRNGSNGNRNEGEPGKHVSQASSYPAVDPASIGAVHAGVSKGSGMSLHVGFQDDKEVKREKRKQSNRESARRSRLRKQAEMEELGKKVESLTVENLALRSQINKMKEDSEKLRSENTAIMEKLGDSKGETPGIGPEGGEENDSKTEISTENFLSKVENATSNSIAHHQAEI